MQSIKGYNLGRTTMMYIGSKVDVCWTGNDQLDIYAGTKATITKIGDDGHTVFIRMHDGRTIEYGRLEVRPLDNERPNR